MRMKVSNSDRPSIYSPMRKDKYSSKNFEMSFLTLVLVVLDYKGTTIAVGGLFFDPC